MYYVIKNFQLFYIFLVEQIVKQTKKSCSAFGFRQGLHIIERHHVFTILAHGRATKTDNDDHVRDAREKEQGTKECKCHINGFQKVVKCASYTQITHI